MTASPEARAKRRYDELKAKGMDVKYDDVLREMIERDKNDSERDIAPCVPAPDAVIFDNSGYGLDESVSHVIEIIESKVWKGK